MSGNNWQPFLNWPDGSPPDEAPDCGCEGECYGARCPHAADCRIACEQCQLENEGIPF